MRRLRPTCSSLALLAALACPAAAFAQHHDMSAMDPDHDGKVSAAEHAAAAQAMFEKADADRDGMLSHEEMMAMHGGMGGMGEHDMADGKKKMACGCCSGGEGGMKGCGMGDKPADPIGEAMSGK